MGWGSVQLLLLVLIPPGSQAGAPLSAGCLSCEKLWKVKERTVHGDDSGLLRPRVSADELGSGAAPPLEADSRLGLKPGMAAPPFTLETLNGKLSYPAIPEQPGLSFTFQAFTNKSGFLECLWSSTASLVALVDGLPPHTHLVFMSFDDSAPGDVRWMKQQLIPVMEARLKNISRFKDFLSRLHFVPIPVYALGNWIPAIFYAWRCQQHNCGLAQVVFTSAGIMNGFQSETF
ncbi:uncharacterized protein LOC125485456 [Rhincodon typus]|uniref:uncharacterized protein LOC125485456 n=1 Tax=Rhincodon typus TaxID=259920 RepID=UPI00202E413E|nr:uncharacterized protein LOC125485456 [Rhincodon typus]